MEWIALGRDDIVLIDYFHDLKVRCWGKHISRLGMKQQYAQEQEKLAVDSWKYLQVLYFNLGDVVCKL